MTAMTVWLSFKIPHLQGERKGGKNGTIVTISEILRIFKDKVVSIKDV